jgi:alanyl-tRNA synthetase
MSDPVATERLYYGDASLARFSATVTELSADGCTVYLDRTAFYPTSGGQLHDLGTLADVAIVDVVDEETRVAHRLATPLGVTAGAMVIGQIDMARRFDHMQQHTGQHLLSALLHDAYGWPTVSVHFGDMVSTLDVAASEIPADHLAEIEARVNAQLVENRAVAVSYEEASTAAGLRKPSDRDGLLRIVTIEGLDRSACGGTHVTRTGEIGMLSIRRADKSKGNTRVEFVCGFRAVRRARQDADLLTRAARPLSAAPADLPQLVEQQQQRLTELERERRRLQQELARYEAREWWDKATTDGAGHRRILIESAGPVKELEPLVQQLLALGTCLVLVTQSTSGGVLLGAAADTNVDAGQQLRVALQQAGGRGGGSPRIAQGAVTSGDALRLVTQTLGF